MTKQRLNPLQVQQQAQAFVLDYVNNRPLGLPEDLTEEQFTQIMDAIVRAMIQAWGDGYYTERGR